LLPDSMIIRSATKDRWQWARFDANDKDNPSAIQTGLSLTIRTIKRAKSN
jgi:hypothetical protein